MGSQQNVYNISVQHPFRCVSKAVHKNGAAGMILTRQKYCRHAGSTTNPNQENDRDGWPDFCSVHRLQ